MGGWHIFIRYMRAILLALYALLLPLQTFASSALETLLASQSVLKQIAKLDREGDEQKGVEPESGLAYRVYLKGTLGEGRGGRVCEVIIETQAVVSDGLYKQDVPSELLSQAIVMKKLKSNSSGFLAFTRLSETVFVEETLPFIQDFGPRYYYANQKKGVILMQKIELLDVKDPQRHHEEAFRQVARDLLQAVDSLHKHDYTHNDIKADNVGFDGSHWRLIDFGTASKANRPSIGKPSIGYHGQMRRMIKGLFGATYPPALNQQNDIRALGILLLELRYHTSLLEKLEAEGLLQPEEAKPLKGIRRKTATQSVRIKDGAFLLQELKAKLQFQHSPLKMAIDQLTYRLWASPSPQDRLIASLIAGQISAEHGLQLAKAWAD